MMGLRVTGVEAAPKLIVTYASALDRATPGAHRAAGLTLEKVWKHYVAGPSTATRIGRQTGHLGRSIVTRALGRGAVTGTPAPYAAIHETGGKTKPHIIRARTRKALRWKVGNVTRFARSVKHPGSKMPARPHMAPSLKLAWPAIEKVYEGQVAEAAKIASANVRSLRRNQLKLAGVK